MSMSEEKTAAGATARPDKVVFIGTYAEGGYLTSVFESGLYGQMAANNVEKSYIDGISAACGKPIDVLSALVTSAYPGGKKLFVGTNETATRTARITNVGSLNLPYLNLFSQTASLKKAAKKWAKRQQKQNPDESVLVIVYAMRLSFLSAAEVIKRIIPASTVINIVPDLPKFMHFNQSALRKYLSESNQRVLCKKQACVDGFVLYAAKMAEQLGVENRPWKVIEGIINARPAIEKGGKSPIKTVVYTGGIEKEYGLELLVEGFRKAALPDTRLRIYGSGSYVPELKEIEKQSPNIEYCGFVDADAAYAAMSGADLLVNPRPSAGEFTKYSCPSKILEYMSTGVPVLMTRLEGIPPEYFAHAYAIERETADGVAEALRSVFALPDEQREQVGKSAKDFVLNGKSAKAQVSRLLEFARSIAAKRD